MLSVINDMSNISTGGLDQVGVPSWNDSMLEDDQPEKNDVVDDVVDEQSFGRVFGLFCWLRLDVYLNTVC